MQLQSGLGAHQTEMERARAADLMRLTPRGYTSVLDAGARDGYFSQLLTEFFRSVTSLDLKKPEVDHERVVCMQGDLTDLPFADKEFDVVFCTEVLEHIPALEKACSEIVRVARHKVVIGVPYRQDIRIGRTTCGHCREVNPPWGHVNSFDESKLETLFRPLRMVDTSYVGTDREGTNALACWLMDLGGNPWGVYDQLELCGHCGNKLAPLEHRSWARRLCSGCALVLNRIQSRLTKPHSSWIHALFVHHE